MMRSMTAYGRGEYAAGDAAFIAEIKSVNNRYRDVILRIPQTLRVIEDEIRAQISSGIRRGRIEVSIQMERKGNETEYDLELNLPLVRSYLRVFHQLGEEFGLEQKVGPEYLCQLRDVILVKHGDVNIDEAREGLREVLKLALDSFDVMRIKEGKAIEEDFFKRLSLIKGHLDNIEERASLVVEEYRNRLRDKINRLIEDIEIDEARMIQEVAIFADKCDITEEIVRARSHLKQFRDYIFMEDAIGRRLDFLIQEIHREVTTISSKAFDSYISLRAVEIKAELEKIREQVQNVE